MHPIIQYIKEKGGYARMKDLKEQGFHTRAVKELYEQNILEKVKPGLYKINPSYWKEIGTSNLVDVCKAIPNGVIALVSALSYHGLTTYNPHKIHVAIPHGDKPPKIEYPPVEIYYFREKFYSNGILEEHIGIHSIRLYNREKTVCDMFRYRNRLGEDLALEGLKNYLKLPDADLHMLQKFMKICEVKTVMEPYIKALVA